MSIKIIPASCGNPCVGVFGVAGRDDTGGELETIIEVSRLGAAAKYGASTPTFDDT